MRLAARNDPTRSNASSHPPRDPSIALFVAALGLRPAVIGIGPIAAQMASSLRVSHLFISLLEAIPIVCMGLFAPLGPYLARRLGDRAAMAVGLAVVAVAASLRSIVPSPVTILMLTLIVGVATGAAGALPSLVGKLRASERGATTAAAASATGIVAGATFAAAAAGPAAAILGGWRPAVALMGAVCLIPLAGWLLAVPRISRPIMSNGPAPTRIWRRPVAWLLALTYGLQGMIYWGANAWLPSALIERGWALSAAAALVALLNVGTLIGNLLLIGLSRRYQHRRLLLLSAALMSVGTFVLAVQPQLGTPSTLILGIGSGMIYPVLLALTITLADDPLMAGSLAAFMLLIGYELSALGPVVLGMIRDAEGSFQAPLAILAVTGWCLIASATVLARHSPPDRQRPALTG